MKRSRVGSAGRCERRFYGLAWAALTVVYVAVPLSHLDAYAWDYDEGVSLQAAALAYAGYPLYSEIAFNKPPLLIWLLETAFALGGVSLRTARLVILFVTLIGFLSLGLLSELWWGRWAGPAAMLLLLLLPEVLPRATVAMVDIPAASAGLAALAMATLFHLSGKRPWLVLSAGAWTAMVSFHPLLLPLTLPLLFILAMRHVGEKPFPIRYWGRDLVSFAGAVIIWLLPMGPEMARAAGIRWLFVYNFLPPPDPGGSRWGMVTSYLFQHWEILTLATVGVILLSRHRREWVFIALTWFVSISLMLVLGPVPRNHYLLLLLYPLIAIAGGGLVMTVRRCLGRQNPFAMLLFAVLLLSLVMRGMTFSPKWFAWSSAQLEAKVFLEQERTQSFSPFVLSDDPFLAFAAGWLVPPPLSDTSFKRIFVGWLDVEEIIENILRYEVCLVVSGTGRLAHLPQFHQWVRRIAVEHRAFDSIHIYRVEWSDNPSRSLGVRLDEGIRLQGYTLSRDTIHAGKTLTVTLLWRREGAIAGDYHIFVHLMDGTGQLCAQHDGPPLLGAYPTSRWSEGILIPDPHPIPIPPDLPPGTYRLFVGMYRWPSLERLPAFRPDGTRWPDDRILLTELSILPAP